MITIVSGAPCSGKSTWIKNNAKSGSIIIDMDRIALALTTEDIQHHAYNDSVKSLAIITRRTAIKKALTLGKATDVYVIDTEPSPEYKQLYAYYGAKWHRMETTLEECLARIKEVRPKHMHQRLFKVAHKYYQGTLNG